MGLAIIYSYKSEINDYLSNSMNKIIKELIAQYPNDTELGKKVRDLVYGIKKIKQSGV